MIVRLGTAPRIDGLDFTDFQRHWRTSHADVVARMPGLRRYQQFHAVLEEGEPLLPYPGFDACSALRFDTVEAMDAAFASTEFVGSVQADEKAFVDKTRFRGVVGTWQPDGEDDLGVAGSVQLLVLVAAEPGVSPAELADRFVVVPAPPGAGAIVTDHGLHDGRFPAAADVVRVAAYADVASALEGAEATRRAAGAAQVIGEHLARVVEVPLGTDADGPTHERTQQ
ncbi:EthD domain-containing protein [Nocardioides hwasunensis]|uniref:EthD domain-containing protein n=1 Tax=Nocardioides hwasunensis TaxID=397258 RepID=A0ABR8ML51_9ACTN|nr:EthD domain-containing protein [Nocardioides hwasunensis]MBD3916751.1 EthD domain-containing protein [Nocardioides hwasunensis]